MAERMDEFKGRLKEGAGSLTGDERLHAEGEAEVERARATRKTRGSLRETGGALREGLGALTGDEVTEAEGRAPRLRGEAERRG
jgi:uncharacterized protein YjbJ (UPF0337 family)